MAALMTLLKRPAVIWGVRLTVSALVLTLLFRIFPARTVWDAAQHIHPLLWVGALLCFLAGHAASAFKWRSLIGPGVPFRAAFQAHLAGLAANLCLPGVAGGDVVRAGAVFNLAKDKSALAMGSLADRLLDTLGLLILSAAGFALVSASAGAGASLVIFTGLGLFVAAVIGGFLIIPPLARHTAGWSEKGKLQRLFSKIMLTAEALTRDPGRLAMCLAISLAVQALFVSINIAFAAAVGVQAPATAWFYAWSASKIIAIAPISLGGLGVREASMAGLMAPFGAAPAQVIAVGLIWQTVLYASGMLGALAQAIWRGGTKAVSGADRRAHGRARRQPHFKPRTRPVTDLMAQAPASAAARGVTRKPKVIILGAGPAGVGAALRLTKDGLADTTVIERQPRVGGNSASFQLDDIWCDFGSHRLHPVTEPHVLADIRGALGDDLLVRPRHGRIRLQKRWIHFPLKPFDLLARLPKPFAAALMLDAVLGRFRPKPKGEATFATVLQQGLGPTISENFYFPYVQKLWALPPEELAVTLAQRRVSGSSIFKILMKVARQLPGLKQKTTGVFYYPRKGFGQITQGFHGLAEKAGARFSLDSEVVAVEHKDGKVVAVRYKTGGVEQRETADAIWSSLPINLLCKVMDPPPPPQVLAAASAIRYRGMILIYLTLEQDQFTEYDAHYFPETAIPMARMSEPKNYSATSEPKGKTILCAELPCDPQERFWTMDDDAIGREMCGWLASVGLPVTAKVLTTRTRRLGQAYPVYDRDFHTGFDVMDDWIGGVEGLLTFGRQGLFAHDNTHHALAMAYAAAECLRPDGSFDKARWAEHRIVFESHVVED